MSEILIFGGTTEGRYLAEFCDRNRILAEISVVSEYGKELLTESDYIKVNAEPMDAPQMMEFISTHGIRLVVDATHPYARQATEHIKKACDTLGVKLLRCLRETGDKDGGHEVKPGNVICVSSVAEAVSFLEHQRGNVLVTTGSKELMAFAGMSGFRERAYVRVLPSLEAIEKCEELGIEKSHLICMQGPFSEELNIALIHQVKAAYLVTKETGAAGGFAEKLGAAAQCGITAVVVKRRPEPEGLSVEEIGRELLQYFKGADSGGFTAALVGIGPGDIGQMTEAARLAIRESDVLFGAPRVLLAVKPLVKDQEVRLIPKYLPADVEQWLEAADKEHCAVKKAAVLFSGDTGFYSGAKKMAEMLNERKIPYHILPGISSVAYFAARLEISWEDAGLYTAHGREFDPVPLLEQGKTRLFLLLGGSDGVDKLCRRLCAGGFASLLVSVGENLSYENERIVRGTASELVGAVFHPLSLVLVEQKSESEVEV